MFGLSTIVPVPAAQARLTARPAGIPGEAALNAPASPRAEGVRQSEPAARNGATEEQARTGQAAPALTVLRGGADLAPDQGRAERGRGSGRPAFNESAPDPYPRSAAEDAAPGPRGDGAAAGSQDGGARRAQPSDTSLSPAEQELIDRLKARDREVREHEQAHARVGGAYAGMPSYTLQTGPDGRRYAVGGQVPIDVAPVAGDPEATLRKMDIVKRAALAPAKPSGADRRIAQLADAQARQAEADLRAIKREAQDQVAEDAAREQARLSALFDLFARLRMPETGAILNRAA